MSLDLYQQKRNFTKTPEPKGRAKNQVKKFIYIIQKHHASHLHYDFRLAFDDVLKSWAIPKGPSFNPEEKRLAVQVEDHPLEYATFEGIIPKGQYGGGTVMLWDKGTWEPTSDVAEGLVKGKLTFNLNGNKLKGSWTLVRINDIKKGKANWLLIKQPDDYANLVSDDELLISNSVKTGRDMHEITAGKKPQSKKTDAISVKMPKKFKPELATLVDAPPDNPDYIYEVKFDGYRIIALIDSKKVKLITRSDNDWTNKLKHLSQNLSKLRLDSAVLDGEIVVLDKNGVSKFQLLQNAMTENKSADIVYYLFDLPYLNGKDLSQIPLIERKKLLKQLLEGVPFDNIRFSKHLQGKAVALLKQACALHLEGLIAKRKNSCYKSTRAGDWLKLKCKNRQEFIIGGYTSPGGSRRFFGSLLVGYYNENGHLIFSGRVGTGFDQKNLKEIYDKMQILRQDNTPFYDLARSYETKNAHWLKPQLIAEVEFAEWTDDLRLRHPSFKGLREDKAAKEVKMETMETQKKNDHINKTVISGISLSHADKIFFPAIKGSKYDLANYYEKHSELILPHLINRPVSILRCPDGASHECFFQKHIEKLPLTIDKVTIQEKTNKKADYLVIHDLAGIITLVQYGTLELHTWGSQANLLEYPDRIIFDLDPGAGTELKQLIKCAKILKSGLDELKLQSFIKTSGKKGLHICIPIDPIHSWDEVKNFSHTIAKEMVKLAPELFIARIPKNERINKILIDYLRNERGATCVSAFSSRATDIGSISTPIHWEELGTLKSVNEYNIENLDKRLKKIKSDPWADYFKIKQSLKHISI
ncbi:MAG: ATP-dependent ligase [Burkholderiales bacterium]|jgi:bifunctional non-homologous end joining protein LigD|nr:ATP-dependent ligase [Burkholderiales bacterium]